MKVIRAATRPTKVQPAANFTGTVYADEVVVGTAPSRMRATVVSFTPGARTAWHTHPVGQTLYCLSAPAASNATAGRCRNCIPATPW